MCVSVPLSLCVSLLLSNSIHVVQHTRTRVMGVVSERSGDLEACLRKERRARRTRLVAQRVVQPVERHHNVLFFLSAPV